MRKVKSYCSLRHPRSAATASLGVTNCKDNGSGGCVAAPLSCYCPTDVTKHTGQPPEFVEPCEVAPNYILQLATPLACVAPPPLPPPPPSPPPLPPRAPRPRRRRRTRRRRPPRRRPRRRPPHTASTSAARPGCVSTPEKGLLLAHAVVANTPSTLVPVTFLAVPTVFVRPPRRVRVQKLQHRLGGMLGAVHLAADAGTCNPAGYPNGQSAGMWSSRVKYILSGYVCLAQKPIACPDGYTLNTATQVCNSNFGG